MDIRDTLQYLDPETNPNNLSRFDNEPFTKIYIDEHKNKVAIRGLINFSGFEKLGIYILYFIGPLIIYYIPVRSFFFIIKLFLIILTFLIARKLVNRFFAIKILEVNKDQKELKSLLDGFITKIDNIKGLSIVEDVYQKNSKEFMKYRLKFMLPDGEKSSVFAFTSYDNAKKILEVIKNS